MKVKPEHREFIRKAICNNSILPTLDQYTRAGFTAKRWRWDCLYKSVASQWICDNVYPYANDDHIDTVLRGILFQ